VTKSTTDELSLIPPKIKELARQGFVPFVAGLRQLLERERQLRRLVLLKICIAARAA
jgi:hypothetical protein